MQPENILKQIHASNNRAVIFNLRGAVIINLTDLVQTELPHVKEKVDELCSDDSFARSTHMASRTQNCSVLLQTM